MRSLILYAALAGSVAFAQGSMRMRNSQDASAMLKDVKRASADVGKHDKNDALTAVDQALSLSSKLERSGPKNGLVPVYREAISIAVFTPSKIVGAPHPAEGTAERVTLPNPTVQDVVGESTREFVNSKEAHHDLEDAQRALQNGELAKAHSALEAFRAAVMEQTVVGDKPLARVRQNLVLAGNQAGQYELTDARTSFSAAVRALEQYADANGRHADGARVLGREITLYEQRMPQDGIEVAGQAQLWWDRVASWTATPYSGRS